MPWTNIAVLCGIVAMFATFGLALAYGQYQTRHINRRHVESAAAEPPAQDERKLAA